LLKFPIRARLGKIRLQFGKHHLKSMTNNHPIPPTLWRPDSTRALADLCMPLDLVEAARADHAGILLSHAAQQAGLLSAFLRIEAYLSDHPCIGLIEVHLDKALSSARNEVLAVALSKDNRRIQSAEHPALIDAILAMSSRIGDIAFGPENLEVLGRDVFGENPFAQWTALRERRKIEKDTANAPLSPHCIASL
jgi:hypothetical protein